MGSNSSKQNINNPELVDLRNPLASILKNSASIIAKNDSRIRANLIKFLKLHPVPLNTIYEAPQEMETSVSLDIYHNFL